jgi:hypothetical protein
MHRRLKGLTPVPARDSSETEAFRQVSMLSAVPPEKATTAAPDDFFAPGNRYELKKELGRGGMGIVYEAVDTALGRRVALKLVNSFDAGADNLKQFLVEGRAIARLSHPNVITVYDIGMMDLRHYIAMEFVDGRGPQDADFREEAAVGEGGAAPVHRGRQRAEGRARRGDHPPRHQAGQRAAHGPAERQARGFRPSRSWHTRSTTTPRGQSSARRERPATWPRSRSAPRNCCQPATSTRWESRCS